jgi:hypothetical protein
MSKKEEFCEKHVQDNYYRDETGKYVVKLPKHPNRKNFRDKDGKSVAKIPRSHLIKKLRSSQCPFQDMDRYNIKFKKISASKKDSGPLWTESGNTNMRIKIPSYEPKNSNPKLGLIGQEDQIYKGKFFHTKYKRKSSERA